MYGPLGGGLCGLFKETERAFHNISADFCCIGGKKIAGKQILRIYFENETHFPLVAYEKQPAGIPFGTHS